MEPSTISAAIGYVHANPVRRRLCERPVDWKRSSASWYAAGIELTPTLPRFLRPDYDILH